MPKSPVLSTLAGMAPWIVALTACLAPLPAGAGRIGDLSAGTTADAAVTAMSPSVEQKVAGGVIDVVEYHNASLDQYFIASDPAEIAILDRGAFGGAWKRTGSTFPAWDGTGAPAGTVDVCRYFGTERQRHPRPRVGPANAFFAADAAQCAALQGALRPVAIDGRNLPDWTFDPDAFAVRLPAGGACPAGTQPLYRSYNNGARCSPNYRHSTRADTLQAMPGWVYQGLVMCLPQGASPPAPGQLAACGESDCPAATAIGSGVGLVNVIVDVSNNTAVPVSFVIPAGQTFVSTGGTYQDGLAVEHLQATVAPGTSARFLLRLFCMQLSRPASKSGGTYAAGPVTTSAPLLEVLALSDGRLGSAGDPEGLKAHVVQFAIWEITDGNGALSATQRGLFVALMAAAADDVLMQVDLAEKFFATVSFSPG